MKYQATRNNIAAKINQGSIWVNEKGGAAITTGLACVAPDISSWDIKILLGVPATRVNGARRREGLTRARPIDFLGHFLAASPAHTVARPCRILTELPGPPRTFALYRYAAKLSAFPYVDSSP